MQFDGGSRGNPGPAGIGVVLYADGISILTQGDYIGRATNNVAEYQALIRGLQEAHKMGIAKLEVRGDSELVIRQMLGKYKVRHPALKPLHAQATELAGRFEKIEFVHNRRQLNTLADELANNAMTAKGPVE